MKVAIVTAFPKDPSAPRGGVEAVSVNLSLALSSFDDLEIHVVTSGPDVSKPRVEKWNGLCVHRLPRPPGSMLEYAIRQGRREITGYLDSLRPDLIHAHDTYGMMVKGAPFPRVFTIHGFIHADTRISGSRFARTRSMLWKRFETAAWADQPHIISISPYVREKLAGLDGPVIHDIDNPISKSFFDIPIRKKEAVVFSAAAICPRKNTLGLIDAFAVLKEKGVNGQLRLAGGIIDESYGRLVRNRIKEAGLDNAVTLLGSLNSVEVREELASAGVFALVSYEENSPMGIEEAMAAGVPIVTSNRCGMPYMVRDGETGFLVDPDDPALIASRLVRLFENEAAREAMGIKAREVAHDRFHPAVVARRTREVYREACGMID